MASPPLIPSGDFRTTYAADTTIFPTATSRNAAIAGIVLICFAPQVLSEYSLSILIQIGIFAIAALGINILVGFTGQISIGHAAFFLFGAFTSAYLSNTLPIPVFFAIPLAGVVTSLVRLLFARRLVQWRLGAGQRQSVLDFRLRASRRPAIFLRGAGLCAGQLPPGDQS